MEIEVRPVRAGDARAATALVRELRYEATEAEITDRLERIAGDPEAQLLVAEAEGTVVGWIHVYGVTWLQLGRFAGVGGMVVSQERRGEGIGGRLLEAAEVWASTRGYPLIRVRSNVVRERAHSFYLERGYQTEKQLFSFLKPL